MADDVRVATFSRRLEAEMAQSVLESQGIRSRLVVDDGGTMLPNIESGLGGAQIFVRPEDAESAREALEQYQAED